MTALLACSGNSYPEDEHLWNKLKPYRMRWVDAIKRGDLDSVRSARAFLTVWTIELIGLADGVQAESRVREDMTPILVKTKWFESFQGKVQGALQARSFCCSAVSMCTP